MENTNIFDLITGVPEPLREQYRDTQVFFEVNGKKVLFVGCVFDPSITKSPKYQPYYPELVGVPVEFVDPWTLEHTIIYPGGTHPKHEPKGYFGSCFSHRWDYFSVREKLDLMEFWLEDWKRAAKRESGYQLELTLEQIEGLEEEIKILKGNL